MVFVVCRPNISYFRIIVGLLCEKNRLTRLLGYVSGDLGLLTRNNTVFSKRKLFKHVDHNFLKFLCYTTFDIWPERQLLRNWRLMKVTASHNVATRIISSYCDATPQRHWRQMTHDNARRAGSSTTFAVKYLWNTRRALVDINSGFGLLNRQHDLEFQSWKFKESNLVSHRKQNTENVHHCVSVE